MLHRPHSFILLFTLLASSHAHAFTDVIVVDGAGGGDATTIQGGIDVAADGDIVLVRPGDYTGFLASAIILAKGLSIIGDVGGNVVSPPVRIHDVPAGSFVLLRNLEVRDYPLIPAMIENIIIRDCVGPIVLEDCRGTGLDGTFNTLFDVANPGITPVFIDNCAGVAIVRSTFHGGDGLATAPFGVEVASNGAVGVLVVDSDVALHGSTIMGGDGGDDLLNGNGGRNGSTAVRLINSVAYVSGDTVTGGGGGDGCTAGQAGSLCMGGTGIAAFGASSVVGMLGSSVTGGPGGVLSGGGAGTDGDAFDVFGTLSQYSGSAPGFELPAVLREGESGTLVVTGEPGDLVGYFFSFEEAYLPIPGKTGVFMIGSPIFGPFILGAVPGSGQIAVPFTIPTMPPAVQGLVHVAQCILRQGNGDHVLSGPSHIATIDVGF